MECRFTTVEALAEARGRLPESGKVYRAGMYGGKFMPYHRGHLYCLETASALCEHVYQILMCGCIEEDEILRSMSPRERQEMDPAQRFRRMKEAGDQLGNVETIRMDISGCRTPDGEEDWDAETPLVLNACGRFDAVFASEPAYGEYFRRAYPWADYILIDPPRIHYPISGSMIRADREGTQQWIV